MAFVLSNPQTFTSVNVQELQNLIGRVFLVMPCDHDLLPSKQLANSQFAFEHGRYAPSKVQIVSKFYMVNAQTPTL